MNLKGKKLLVPGGMGFIGSAFCRVARAKGYDVAAFDAMTYASDTANVEGFEVIRGDISVLSEIEKVASDFDAIVSFAAGSHVDKSIYGGMDAFIATNVTGVQNLIEVSRQIGIPFLGVSSDEVYGPIAPGLYADENAPLRPENGYSASKACGDLLIKAACNTFKAEIVVTRCVNNYGPRQHPEKLVPRAITCALQNKPIPIAGSGQYVRSWIWVEDHAKAVLLALEKGTAGAIYNVSSMVERTNLEIACQILDIVGRPRELIRFVPDRPGQDERYGITNDRIRALGWKPEMDFGKGLEMTVEWYRQNKKWWETKCL